VKAVCGEHRLHGRRNLHRVGKESAAEMLGREFPFGLVRRVALKADGEAVRSGPSPVTSYTSTESLTPLTLVAPSGLRMK